MAVRYDPALINGIAGEIGSRYVGRQVEGIRFDREQREVYVHFPGTVGEPGTIGLLLHPTRGYIVCDGRRAPEPQATGRRIDFRRLFLTRVWTPEDERMLVFDLAGGMRDERPDLPPVFRLYVELHTNQWNAVLARGVDDRVEAVLWPRTAGGRALRPGVSYKRPEGGRGWADAKPSQAEWADLWDAVPPGERRAALLRSAAWVSSLNVDWILGEPADADDPGDPGARDRAYDRYIAVRTGAHESWLVTLPGGLQPYPVRLRTDARRCASLLDAMRISAIESSALTESENEQPPEQRQAEATPESEHLGNRLRRRIRDLEKRRAALRRQLEGESAEDLRDLGNLLLARKGEVPKGAERATLTGFDGREVEVSLDPRLDAIRNAERLYDRARRRERAARSIPDRVQRTEDRIAQLESGLETVNATGATAELWDLVGGRPEGTDSSRRDERSAREAPLPYRRYRSSGGLEIRVGRSSRTNDALTFRHSAPDDIWLHARQAAGAHVILRWGSRDQNPPSADLEEAARIAAVHSEARHSGLVAVDWTRRKHVRKPRKAAPGAVVPERVKTLFVEPDAAAIKKLAVDE